MQTFNNIINYYNEINMDYHISQDKSIRKSEWSTSGIKVGNPKAKGDYIGFIMKNGGFDLGNDNVLLCLDIDAKRQYGNTEQEQVELYEKVSKIMNIHRFYPWVERTTSGGFHIFLSISKLEAEKLNFSSIVVEKTEDGKKAKKEIEIFWEGRYLVTAPSNGYELKHGEFIDFSKLDTTTLETVEMLKSLELDEKKDFKFDEDIEVNTGATTTYLNKAFTNIDELKRFKAGEWFGYNQIEKEIMRFFICLNQEDEFLRIIKENWGEFYHVWESYPKKFLDKVDNKRIPSKDSKHLEWLKKIGFLKKKSKKEENINDEMMELCFGAITGKQILAQDDTFFIFNGKHYYWLDPLKYKEEIYKYYKEQFNKRLDKDTLSELVHHFHFYLSSNKKDSLVHDKMKKIEYIPLAFDNGTLYINANGTEFRPTFDPEDNCLVKFSFDYQEDFHSNGSITEWVEARFKTFEKRKFFKMALGDLYSTATCTEIHSYFWGEGGIGKSTIATLQLRLLDPKCVGNLRINEIESKFGKVKLLKYPIINADEAEDERVKAGVYKSSISREGGDFEMKNVQNFNGTPIAKLMTFANQPMKIKFDTGIKRRLKTLKIDSGKIRTDLTPNQFTTLLYEDRMSFVKLIIEGIELCFLEGWDINTYYNAHFSAEQQAYEEQNDTFSYFLSTVFMEDEKSEREVTPSEAFQIYNNFLSTLEGTAIQKMSMPKFKEKMEKVGFQNKQKRVDGARIRVYENMFHTNKSLYLLEK